MIKPPTSLVSRMTLWFVASFVAFLIFAFLVSYFAMGRLLNGELEEDLEEDIEEFQLLYNTGGFEAVITEIDREAQSDEADEEFLQLLDARGNKIYSSDITAWQGLTVTKDQLIQVNENPEPVMMNIKLETQEYKTKTILAQLDENMLLFLGESTEQNHDVLELLQIIFLAMLLITIPITVIVIRLLSKKSVVGIEEVSKAAFAIQQGEFDRRAQVSAKDIEIQQLAETFNSMADRIKNLITEMREMIDNIAHDLRSPIARIRAISESTLSSKQQLTTEDYQNSISDTLEECDRLINLINTTLDVAEAEADISSSEKQSIDVSQLVAEACELFEPLAEQKSIQFTNRITPDCKVFGNQHNLQRMIINLIDNALKYTQSDGKVSVELSSLDDKIVCTIQDNGMGIPQTDQEKIFQRFYRTDLSRGEQGCGLGLSFARAVARAHDGEIELKSKLDSGSRFTVILPKNFDH